MPNNMKPSAQVNIRLILAGDELRKKNSKTKTRAAIPKKMNKKILNYIIFIIIASILLYFARHNYRDFNINKAISACVLAKKQNTTNFDKDLVKKQCEEKIKKSIKKTN